MTRDTTSVIFKEISPTPCLATRCLGICHKALLDEPGMIITQMRTNNRSENCRSAWDALYDTNQQEYYQPVTSTIRFNFNLFIYLFKCEDCLAVFVYTCFTTLYQMLRLHSLKYEGNSSKFYSRWKYSCIELARSYNVCCYFIYIKNWEPYFLNYRRRTRWNDNEWWTKVIEEYVLGLF
jgi:hypothetical protein